MNIALRLYSPILYVKAFPLTAFLQMKIVGISEMLNLQSAEMPFLTYIFVLIYSSGLNLCPCIRNGDLNSAIQKVFLNVCDLCIFSLHSLSCIAFN